MKIAVCIKQVPDNQSLFRLNENNRINTENLPFKINNYDLYAIEEALRIRDKFQGEVIIISAGPESSEKHIRRALAMGADSGILLTDPSAYEGDEFACASAISSIIKNEGGFNMVLTGVQTEDFQSGITGMIMAANLGWSALSNVIEICIEEGSQALTATRECEEGAKEWFRLTMPAVLSVQSGINMPRYPTVPGIINAKKKPVELISESANTYKSRSMTVALSHSSTKTKAEIIEGDTKEAARILAKKLIDDKKAIRRGQ